MSASRSRATVVLDASVAVAAQRPHELHYPACRERVDVLLGGAGALVVPALFVVEVTAALGRGGHRPEGIRRYVRALTSAPHDVVVVGRKRTQAVAEMALACGLRGADAHYVWLARELGLPLCTVGREVAERAADVCHIIAP